MFYSKEIGLPEIESADEGLGNRTDFNRLSPAALILEKTIFHFGAMYKSEVIEVEDSLSVSGGLSWVAPLKRDPAFSLRFSATYSLESSVFSASLHHQSALGIYNIPYAELKSEDPTELRVRLKAGQEAYQILGMDAFYFDHMSERGQISAHLSDGGFFRLGSSLSNDRRPDPDVRSSKFSSLTQKVSSFVYDQMGIYMPEEAVRPTTFEEQQRILLES